MQGTRSFENYDVGNGDYIVRGQMLVTAAAEFYQLHRQVKRCVPSSAVPD